MLLVRNLPHPKPEEFKYTSPSAPEAALGEDPECVPALLPNQMLDSLRLSCAVGGNRITWRKPHLSGMVTTNQIHMRRERGSNPGRLDEKRLRRF
ncbi:hypothetical protein DPMN_043928 [Dreissena polymorpha]|uniref:Uncharacterized protein n=1 Tax=Dreissena polymorpha TaxID=45954 RepID=A0A9D4D3L5_DREPO|nr:hypothetical protein DPMN_043928 [Dreissena polymorpha]